MDRAIHMNMNMNMNMNINSDQGVIRAKHLFYQNPDHFSLHVTLRRGLRCGWGWKRRPSERFR